MDGEGQNLEPAGEREVQKVFQSGRTLSRTGWVWAKLDRIKADAWP